MYTEYTYLRILHNISYHMIYTYMCFFFLVKNSLLTKYRPTTNGKPTEASTGDGKQYTRRMCIVINDPQSDVPQ